MSNSSYTVTINIIKFNFSVFTFIAILVKRHIVSHSFINFEFCCVKSVSENIIKNILENNYFEE